MAERDLKIEVINEIAEKSGERARSTGAGPLFNQAGRLSKRRACTLLSGARSGLDHQCKMAVKDQPIVAAMRQYSEQYPRYGARRIRIFLRRDGLVLGRDRTARIWARAGLQVPAKRTRKRYRNQNRQPHVVTGPNEVWAYNFVFDASANGQKLKCLTLINEFTK